MPSTETARYTKTAIFLHWLIGLAILGLLALGWSFEDMANGPFKGQMYQLHKSVGMVILLLSLFRLVWRLVHRAPPLPAAMPKWEKISAHLAHVALYAAMIGMPLSGWAMSSAHGKFPIVLFGLVPWPDFPLLAASPNRHEIAELLENVHGFGATLLALLLVAHVAAALRHHFVIKDDILTRMLPARVAACLQKK